MHDGDTMQAALMSLGDLIPTTWTAGPNTEAGRYEQLLDQVVWAEEAGFSAVHLGEHHFSNEFLLSAPPVVLAAIAMRTQSIRLSTAVTLGANLDPVRIAEDYATVDVLSHGRVEIVFGRGTGFPETFRNFGQDIRKSRDIYVENIDLVRRLLSEENVHWRGSSRAHLEGVTSRPRPYQPELPLWIAAGTEGSAEHAADASCALLLPTTSRMSDEMVPVVDAYRKRWNTAEKDPAGQCVGVSCHIYVDNDEGRAKRRFLKRYEHYCTTANPILANPFDIQTLVSQGPAVFGTPEQCIERINQMSALYNHDRQLFMFDFGAVDNSELQDAIALFGSEVYPFVCDLPARCTAPQ